MDSSDNQNLNRNPSDNLGVKSPDVIGDDSKVDPFKRDEKGRLLPGHAGGPGRPKGKTLKEYKAEKFRTMSDEEKEEWFEKKRISGIDEWRMAEGNPKQDNTHEISVPDNLIELIRHGTANQTGDNKLSE